LNADKERGYLLLELVIAAAVFLMVLAPLLQLGVRLSQQQARNSFHNQAVELASQEMEQLLADIDNSISFGERQGVVGNLPCQIVLSRQIGEDYDVVSVVVKYRFGADKDEQVAFTRAVEKE
jgi:type II secretory pathway pseudopilin PulG